MTVSTSTDAAELARQLRAPTWLCRECGSPMWYRPIASSGAHICENKECGWLAFIPEREGAVPARGRS